MTYIEVEPGVRIFVQDLGEGSPVVLVPGFGMTHEVWDRQVRVLTGAGHRVICLDQRGHGRSDKPLAGYEVDRLASDVVAVVDALEVDTFALAGWSFGGQVSFRVAARIPARVTKLLIIGSNAVRATRSPDFPFGADQTSTVATMVSLESANRFAARRQTIRSAFASEPDPTLLEWMVQQFAMMPSWSAVAGYHSMLETDLTEDVAAVTMPVLQVNGDSDPLHSRSGADWLTERLSDARLAELPGCGHFPMFEAPDEFDQALLGFLR